LLTVQQKEDLIESICNTILLDNKTLSNLIDQYAIYFGKYFYIIYVLFILIHLILSNLSKGMTFRSVEQERGANVPQGGKYNGQRNRPVLLLQNRKVITRKLLWGELEAKCKLY
jgi:hypothetical protein